MLVLKKCLPYAIAVALVAPMKSMAFDVPLKTQMQKYSYILGLRLGTILKSEAGKDLDILALMEGIEGQRSGSKVRLDEDEMKKVFAAQRKTDAEKKALAGKENVEKGKAFLAKNKTVKGIVTLENGLQYKIIKAGKGESPKNTDKVTVHYEGKLIDGTIFDSSIQRGKPASFALNGVIKGFREALSRMKVGSKWQVYIPSVLAYGDRAMGAKIGPNSTLIFDMELLSIDTKNKLRTTEAVQKTPTTNTASLEALKAKFKAKIEEARKRAEAKKAEAEK